MHSTLVIFLDGVGIGKSDPSINPFFKYGFKSFTQVFDSIPHLENQKISMDGKGRALDNVYIERFWRSIKQEKIYLNPPNGGMELYQIVKEYIQFYNEERRYTEIGKVPPDQKYYHKKMAS